MAAISYYFYRLFIDPLLSGVRKMVKDLVGSGSIVLDIGCGTGELVFSLAAQAKRVIGIDRNEKILEYAERKRNRLKIDNISFLVQDINEGDLFTETEQSFDYAIFSMFLHQISIVRCPGHTIQFLNYGYSQYIRKVLELSEIDPEKIEWRFYDDWTPYHSESRKDKLQSFKEDQSGSGQIGSNRIS